MSVPTDRDVYVSRCLRVAAEAQAAGLKMIKCGPLPTLKVSHNGREVTFPIVTDARTWRETTVEEAFYVVLVDAHGWSSASDSLGNPGVITSLDETERTGLPLVRKDLGVELERIKSLADMLGGVDKLNALYATAGIGEGRALRFDERLDAVGDFGDEAVRIFVGRAFRVDVDRRVRSIG